MYSIHTFTYRGNTMPDKYESAKIITVSGATPKNKGFIFIGSTGQTCGVKFRSANSDGSWSDQPLNLTIGTNYTSGTVVPVSIYGATAGTGSLFLLN